jgi:hypothetical protein
MPQRASEACPGGEGDSALARGVTVMEEEQRHVVSMLSPRREIIGDDPLTDHANTRQ